MSLPGFTADASLFKTDVHYRPLGNWSFTKDPPVVVPQQFQIGTHFTQGMTEAFSLCHLRYCTPCQIFGFGFGVRFCCRFDFCSFPPGYVCEQQACSS
jgi:hypothetical protein